MTATVAEVGSKDRLSFTLFIAAAFHAMVIFGVTFSLNEGSKVAPTLNITLATHSSKTAPEKADFLAQYNQEASGTAETVKEITTKQQAQLDDIIVQETNPDPQQKATEQKTTSQKLITAEKNATRKALSINTKDNEADQEKKEGSDTDNPLMQTEYASLRAKLDQLKQELASKPRIRRLTSVSTKASHDAAYLNEWAQKIEFVGNKNFPELALQRKIFGKLRLSVILNPNGVVDNVEILKSSGHTILDEAAMKIVRLSSPFKPIPREVRKDNDKLEIIRTWRFEITGLSTSN